MVSGGAGSELHRVLLPDDHPGLPIDEVSRRFRDDQHATLLAVTRGGKTYVNPAADFELDAGDEALIVAQTLGHLRPAHHRAEATQAAPNQPVAAAG